MGSCETVRVGVSFPLLTVMRQQAQHYDALDKL